MILLLVHLSFTRRIYSSLQPVSLQFDCDIINRQNAFPFFFLFSSSVFLFAALMFLSQSMQDWRAWISMYQQIPAPVNLWLDLRTALYSYLTLLKIADNLAIILNTQTEHSMKTSCLLFSRQKQVRWQNNNLKLDKNPFEICPKCVFNMWPEQLFVRGYKKHLSLWRAFYRLC